MTRTTFAIIILSLLCTSFAHSQNAKLKRAEKLMLKHNYTSSIDLYLKVLNKSNSADAIIGLAECFRRVGNIDETEYWYSRVVQLDNPPKKSYLYYAMALQQNDRCDEAKEWAEKYLKEVESSNTQAMWLVKSCEESVLKGLQVSGKLYQVEALDKVNTENDEFAPQIYKGDLVFVSSREQMIAEKRFNRWSDQEAKSYTELFFVERAQVGDDEDQQYKYGEAEKFTKYLSTKYHDGPVAFGNEGKDFYYTRSNMDGKGDDGIVRLKIYQSKGARTKLTDPRSLPFNSNAYSVMHPSVSEDGETLFFASDRPGGFGGFDLYVSYLEDGRWSPPVNLGPTVNTEGNEVFPYYHRSGTLYFASNGLVGLGGLDIHMSKENYGTWQEPVNLGYPINTRYDDFAFVINDEQSQGYFSSNREGGKGGDDLYTFTKQSITVELIVFDEKTQIPLEGADVFSPCSEIMDLITNIDGKIYMDLPLNVGCDFVAEKFGYQSNAIRISTMDLIAGKNLYVEIPLKSSCSYVVGGTIIDGLTNEVIQDAKVTIKTYSDGEFDEQYTQTDSAGFYEFLDIQGDSEVRVIVEKDGYTKGVSTFSIQSDCGQDQPQDDLVQSIPLYCFGENCPDNELGQGDMNDECVKDSIFKEDGSIELVLCDDRKKIISSDGEVAWFDAEGNEIEQPGQLGKPQLVHIYYDYDDARIRRDAKPALQDLVRLMEGYPEMKIKITSHTDARGKKNYNKSLSKRRAESVIKFLMSRGIAKSRLKATGMGEELMINDCYDGVECTEQQHQENRRTEFIITEYIPSGYDGQSKQPDVIDVKPCKDCPSAPDVETN